MLIAFSDYKLAIQKSSKIERKNNDEVRMGQIVLKVGKLHRTCQIFLEMY